MAAMDMRLFEAAQNGNIDYLHQILRENPLILNTIALLSTENPLTVASNMGHLDFVKEILRLKPEFVKEVNQGGFSPMHIAAANGYVELVKEFINIDYKLCRLEGRQKKTPLHFAATKGKVEVIMAMLMYCPDCVEDVTVERETALHLAVKNNQFEAVKILVDWIKEMNKEDVLNMKDEQGNTVLHLAIWKKQRQTVELIVSNGDTSRGSFQVNSINHSGLTALDVLLIFPSEAGDREIIEILQGAGAKRAKDITIPTNTIPNHNQTFHTPTSTPERHQSQPNHWHEILRPKHIEYFRFRMGRDSPSEARSTLLVIAVLVATATFQVGLNPPGGTWQDTSIPDQHNNTTNYTAHFAGQCIWGTTEESAFALFVLFNSIGFCTALYMIYILTSRFPLQFELQICLVAMFSTYNTALINITPSNLKLYVTLITTILSSTITIIVLLVRQLAKKLGAFIIGVIRAVS